MLYELLELINVESIKDLNCHCPELGALSFIAELISRVARKAEPKEKLSSVDSKRIIIDFLKKSTLIASDIDSFDYLLLDVFKEEKSIIFIVFFCFWRK